MGPELSKRGSEEDARTVTCRAVRCISIWGHMLCILGVVVACLLPSVVQNWTYMLLVVWRCVAVLSFVLFVEIVLVRGLTVFLYVAGTYFRTALFRGVEDDEPLAVLLRRGNEPVTRIVCRVPGSPLSGLIYFS